MLSLYCLSVVNRKIRMRVDPIEYSFPLHYYHGRTTVFEKFITFQRSISTFVTVSKIETYFKNISFTLGLLKEYNFVNHEFNIGSKSNQMTKVCANIL